MLTLYFSTDPDRDYGKHDPNSRGFEKACTSKAE
jgi:hypothetical protein